MESDPFRLRGFHAVSRAFPDASAKNRFFPNSTGHPRAALQPPLKGLGSCAFARRYLRNLF